MTDTTDITIENRLVAEKRAINVYQHSTRGAHIISSGGSITLPLAHADKDDFLHVSVSRGPGRLQNDCILDVPSWADFQFESERNVTFTHKGNRMQLNIPPGLPTWQIKITRPKKPLHVRSDYVIIR